MTSLAQAPALTPLPASVWVACGHIDCSAFGIQRQIWLKQVAVGVVDLPTLACVACRSLLQIPLFQDVEEAPVPKIHVGREPSYREDISAAAAPVAAEPVGPAEVEAAADAAPAETEETTEAPTPAKARKSSPRRKAS